MMNQLKHQRHHQRTFAFLQAFIFLILLSAFQASSTHSTVLDRVVAIVNHEIITLSELKQATAKFENPLFHQLNAQRLTLDSRPAYRDTLRMLIEKKLQLQAARKIGITVGPDELEQAIREIKLNQGITSDTALQRMLSKNDLSLSDYTNEIKDQLIILKMINREVRSSILLQEEEVQAYYSRHAENFKVPESIRLSQILLTVPQNANEEQIREAQAKAKQIRMQIINGADFEDLSKTHSDSPEASFGGDLGYFKKGRLLKEIDQEVFSLKVGDVSNIIRTPLGFHIFKVMDKKEGEIMAYEDVKHQLEEKLFSEQSDNAYKQWLKRLRDQAYVEIKM